MPTFYLYPYLYHYPYLFDCHHDAIYHSMMNMNDDDHHHYDYRDYVYHNRQHHDYNCHPDSHYISNLCIDPVHYFVHACVPCCVIVNFYDDNYDCDLYHCKYLIKIPIFIKIQ